MKKLALAGCALALTGATPLLAQEQAFVWGGEFEIGVDSTVESDDPAGELTDNYASLSLAFEAGVATSITLFGEVTLESVTDPAETRQFDDLGLYVNELGLRFDLAAGELSVGKVSPTFAVAWDAAPGFYGTSLAEDYELSEVIGATFDMPVAASGGVLSFALFYADDTAFSDSLGTKRGRNTTADGGAGNTGKLNNVALQYTQEVGDTTYWVGGRFLTAGDSDVSDEKGAVIGMAHDFGNGFDLIAEVAYFDGFAGTGEDSTYATLGGSYVQGPWAYSASYTGIDNTANGYDDLITVGVDYTFENDMSLGGGVGFYDVDGDDFTAVGASLVIPF